MLCASVRPLEEEEDAAMRADGPKGEGKSGVTCCADRLQEASGRTRVQRGVF